MTTHAVTPAGRGAGEWVARHADPLVATAAVVLAVASLLSSDVRAVDPRLRDADALSVVATAVAAASLGWRRTRPCTSYAVFLLGCLVVSGTFHYIASLAVLLLFSLFSLATHASRRQAQIGLAVAIAAFVVLGLAGLPDLRLEDVLLSIALLVATWAVAETLRTRREHQGDRVQAAVVGERLRIARELHDVIAHSMSLIAVQAGVGAHVIRTDPAAAQQSLEVIAQTSRQALEQTRSMLGVLRDETEGVARRPVQGLADLSSLVEDVRAAGLQVDLVVAAAVGPVDATVSLAAYRIVQESLTNVIKHSAADHATVAVTVDQKNLRVVVTDPGPLRGEPTGGSSGHGLIGLGERVRLVDGDLVFGAWGLGFVVDATFPVVDPR